MKIINALAERKRPFYSLEFFPPKDETQWPEFFEAVDKLKSLDPLFASVTYGAGGGTQDNTLVITKKIKDMGLNPMPHLTCVNATQDRLAAFLRELEDIGVCNVMALRGDAPQTEDFSWDSGEFR